MGPMMLWSEKLTEKITIQKPKAVTPDGIGWVDPSNADNWETHCLAFAEVAEVSSAMARRVGVTRETTTHVIRVRYCSAAKAITGDMRVKRRDGSYLAIVAAPRDPNQGCEELVFEAVLGTV